MEINSYLRQFIEATLDLQFIKSPEKSFVEKYKNKFILLLDHIFSTLSASYQAERARLSAQRLKGITQADEQVKAQANEVHQISQGHLNNKTKPSLVKKLEVIKQQEFKDTDKPSIVNEVLEHIQLECFILDEAIQRLTFQNSQDVANLSEIYFEIRESQELFKEIKLKYENKEGFTSVVDSLTGFEKAFAQLEAGLNQAVGKQAPALSLLLENYQKALEARKDALNDSTYEWRKQNYSRCLEVYANAVKNPVPSSSQSDVKVGAKPHSVKQEVNPKPLENTTDTELVKNMAKAKRNPVPKAKKKGVRVSIEDVFQIKTKSTPTVRMDVVSEVKTQGAIKVKPPCGILNGGNNCYAIATMQALLANPSILKKIQEPSLPPFPLMEPGEELTPKGQEKMLAYEEERLKLEAVQDSLQAFAAVFQSPKASPQALNRALIDLRNTIFEYSLHPSLMLEECTLQQDAADFCSVILRAIGYSFDVEIKNKATYQEPETKSAPLQLEGVERVSDPIFQLGIKNRDKVSSLQELIQENLTETIDNQDNAWRATSPEGKSLSISKYERSMSLAGDAPPKMICMQIKRYNYKAGEGAVRISDAFALDSEFLDLKSLVAPNANKPVLYRLVSCVNHFGGKSANSGHYTSYIRKQEQWFHCSDGRVNPCTSNEVTKGNSYLFMLEKVESDG